MSSKSKTNAMGIGWAVLIVLLLTTLLHFRAGFSAEQSLKTPLVVDTVQFELHDSYQRPVSYLGLVQSGRKADLGFEITGLISSEPLRPGTKVQRGDVIAQLDTTALQSERTATAAELEQARIELELAQLKAQRQKDLIATGAVSRDVFDETRLRALALASRVDAVAARLSSIDILLHKSLLLAPYDAIVADRFVQQGAVVNPGNPVARVLQIGDQESHIGISAERAREFKIGDSYALKLRDTTFQGKLVSVHPDIDPVTRTTTAVFEIPADVEALEGEPLTLELLETVHERGGWLPIAALLEGSRGVWTVLKLVPDGESFRTEREAVEVLDVLGDRAIVRGTLASGSRVIASGVHRISPGSIVSITGKN